MQIKYPFLLFLGLSLGLLMNGIDLLAIGIAIEPMRRDLGINIATLQWFLTAFAIGNASFLATSGRLSDFYGRRFLFMSALIIFALSSMCIALANSPLLIIIARLIQGACGGVFPTVGIAIIVSLYPPKERTKWIGGLIGLGGVGLALGPAVGGVLIHYFSWRTVFLINIPISLIALFLVYKYVPKMPLQRKEGEKIDWLGVFLLTVTLFSFTVGISQGHLWGWLDSKTLLFFGVTLVALLSLIFWELKVAYPFIEFNLFKTKNFLAANLGGSILYFGVIAWILVTGLYLQRVLNLSPLDAGLSMLPFGLFIAILSPFMGKISHLLSPKRCMVIGFFLGALAFFGMGLMGPHPSYFTLTSLFALYGVSFILTNSCSIPAALEYMPVEKSGIATGKTMMIRWLGGSLGGAIITAFFLTHSSLQMEKFIAQNQTWIPFQPKLHEIITGDQSESLLSSLFQGNTLNQAKEMIDLSYHHGFRVSMFFLAALFIVALSLSQFFIVEKQK